MEANEIGKDNINPEKKRLVEVKLSQDLLAEIERSNSLIWRKRQETIEEWLRWAVESLDSKTGKLPDRHPTTGRTLSEINMKVRNTFGENKQSTRTSASANQN